MLNEKPVPKINQADQTVVNQELNKIKQEQWSDSAVLSGAKIDYSLFKARGHYITTTKLKRYFRGMSWLGVALFNTKTVEERKRAYLCAEILSANPKIKKAFNDLYEITAFYAGTSDDPNFYQLAEIWAKETGKPLNLNNYNDRQLQEALKQLFAQYQAKLETLYADSAKNQNKALRLMGQRYVADSHLFGILLKKAGVKYLPGGLDLFAAMEHQTARRLVMNENNSGPVSKGQTEAYHDAAPIFTKIGEDENEPLFNKWIRLLKVYANSNEQGLPSVLKTEHWQKKKLNAALASWTELKHDTILYCKPIGAECGGGDEPPKVFGYIEPELSFYKTTRATLTAMDQKLKKLGAYGVHGLDQALELLDFFILVSEKELHNLPLSTQENEQLRIIGGLLEANTILALDAKVRWWEITSESAKNMAAVADVLQYWGRYQTEGVGYADDLYIIIPVQGQLYLMRGAIFSHYEFLSEKRLSDSEWYEQLKENNFEKRAKWWREYLEQKKEEIPVPADPYDSGC